MFTEFFRMMKHVLRFLCTCLHRDPPSGKYPELSATGGVHEGHRRLVRGLRLLRLQRPPRVRPRQLCLQVGKLFKTEIPAKVP